MNSHKLIRLVVAAIAAYDAFERAAVLLLEDGYSSEDGEAVLAAKHRYEHILNQLAYRRASTAEPSAIPDAAVQGAFYYN